MDSIEKNHFRGSAIQIPAKGSSISLTIHHHGFIRLWLGRTATGYREGDSQKKSKKRGVFTLRAFLSKTLSEEVLFLSLDNWSTLMVLSSHSITVSTKGKKKGIREFPIYVTVNTSIWLGMPIQGRIRLDYLT